MWPTESDKELTGRSFDGELLDRGSKPVLDLPVLAFVLVPSSYWAQDDAGLRIFGHAEDVALVLEDGAVVVAVGDEDLLKNYHKSSYCVVAA